MIQTRKNRKATATPDDLSTLGGRLRYCRNKAGLTQADVAETFGVSQGAVYQHETNKTGPATEALPVLAGMYGVSLEWLLTGGDVLPSIEPKGRTGKGAAATSTSVHTEGLNPLHIATLDLLCTTARAGLLPNADCLELMTDWQKRLDAHGHQKNLAEQGGGQGIGRSS
jgi:transcriptional regulator with XRE-family HTH domain